MTCTNCHEAEAVDDDGLCEGCLDARELHYALLTLDRLYRQAMRDKKRQQDLDKYGVEAW